MSIFFKRLLWILNILAAAALLPSLLAAYISPEKAWWLALFGLAFELLMFIHFLFFLYYLFSRNRKFLLSLFFLLIGIGNIFGIVQFHPFAEDPVELKKQGYIKVMSYNVRLFDLYNWFHNQQTRKKIFGLLQAEAPDIVCFQEYYSSENKKSKFNNEDTLSYFLKAKHRQIEYSLTLRGTDHWGIAIYSKYPIVNKKVIHLDSSSGNVFIYSDIKIGKDTIRVFNTHLESVRLGWKDYQFIENLRKEDFEQDEIAGSKSILRNLRRAFIKRARQVNVLRDSVNASPYPVILCGDFNDTPSSYTYRSISKSLKDAYRESGNGFGKTYVGPFPSFRIDYIFHSKSLNSGGYETVKKKLSDHYPVTTMIALPEIRNQGSGKKKALQVP